MPISLFSRRSGSLERLGPGDPRPPLPGLPLFIVEPRGDAPVSAPFTSGDPYEFDPPAVLRTASAPASFRPGDQVTQDASSLPGAPGRWGAHWTLERAAAIGGYPSRIYAIGDVAGLRWERLNGRGSWALNYDTASVVEELPVWVVFGSNGATVVDVLETVAALTPDQVWALPLPAHLDDRSIPLELVTPPEGHPDAKLARRASLIAMGWTENRGWAVDLRAGDFYYSGCYFVFNLVEPHWLGAMGRAMNAASVAVLGDAVAPDVRTRVAREWAELASLTG